jgi:hypothetical protein
MLSDLPPVSPREITAVAMSREPAHVLYYGASDTRDDPTLPPRLFRIDNADTDPQSAVDITPAGASAGAYVADIAVNPLDAREILVVFSNYNVIGIYHSTDGGERFSAVEGNLAGTTVQPGPSLRSAAILTLLGTPYYFVGTSAGLFAARALAGDDTEWEQEAADEIGLSVVWDLDVRQSDSLLAVATHGRGLYLGSVDEDFDPRPQPDAFQLAQNYPNPFSSTTRITYDLVEASRVSLTVFDLAGRRVTTLIQEAERDEGRYEESFDASGLASGTYLYQLVVTPLEGDRAGRAFARARKLMVIH